MGSNHILFDRTVRLSGDDQIRLISASSNLRSNNYISDEIKNNTSISEDVVSGPVDWDATSPDNTYIIASQEYLSIAIYFSRLPLICNIFLLGKMFFCGFRKARIFPTLCNAILWDILYGYQTRIDDIFCGIFSSADPDKPWL